MKPPPANGDGFAFMCPDYVGEIKSLRSQLAAKDAEIERWKQRERESGAEADLQRARAEKAEERERENMTIRGELADDLRRQRDAAEARAEKAAAALEKIAAWGHDPDEETPQRTAAAALAEIERSKP